jgi:hypothetical protein
VRISWQRLPKEERYLYNPAFLAVLIARTVQGYQAEASTGLPLPLIYVALVLVIQRPTRDQLPHAVSTNLLRWIQRNPEVRTLMPVRARAFVPLIREAVLFALTNDICILGQEGRLELSSGLRSWSPSLDTEEVEQCFRSARFVGRWFARSGTPETVFVLFGLRP